MAWAWGIAGVVFGYLLGSWAKGSKLSDAQAAIDWREHQDRRIVELEAEVGMYRASFGAIDYWPGGP